MIMTVSFVISATLRHSRPARGPPRGRSRHSTLTRRAVKVFATKPDLRDCGVSIVTSVLVPKNVYHFTFGKATVAAVEETERGYGDIIRQSVGVARGFPCNVLAGSLEFDGLGALQLATEVTKARLRQFQSMLTSSALSDCSVAMAMVSLAQQWCGSSTPVNMLSTYELHLLESIGAMPPQAAHMFHEGLATKWQLDGSFDLQQQVTKRSMALTCEKLASLAAPRRS